MTLAASTTASDISHRGQKARDSVNAKASEGQKVTITLSGKDAEDIQRILARIAHAADRRHAEGAGLAGTELKAAPLKLARQLHAVRECRHRFLKGRLSGQLAWDILLLLYLGEKAAVRYNIGQVIKLSHSTFPTGLRHIDHLEAEGLVRRERDKHDGRIIYLILLGRGRKLMEKILSAGVSGDPAAE